MKIDCRAIDGSPAPDPDEFNAIMAAKYAARQTRQQTFLKSVVQSAKGQQALDDTLKVIYAVQWTSQLGELTHLNPSEGAKYTDWLAFLFDESYGSANDLRADQQRIQNGARGVINAQARIELAGRLNTFDVAYSEAAKRANLDKQTSARLFYDSLEIGGIPATEATAGFTPGLRSFNVGRVQAWRNNMISQGFTMNDVDLIQEMATQVQTAMHEVVLAVQSTGVNLSTIEGVGYMPRMYTPQAKKYIQRIYPGDPLVTPVSGSDISFATIHNRSRGFNYVVPEDLVLISELTGQSPGKLYGGTSVYRTPFVEFYDNVADVSDKPRFRRLNSTVFIPTEATEAKAVERHKTHIVTQIRDAFLTGGSAEGRTTDYDLLEQLLDASGYDYVSLPRSGLVYSRNTTFTGGTPLSRKITRFDSTPPPVVGSLPNSYVSTTRRQLHSALPDIFSARFSGQKTAEFIADKTKSGLSAIGIDTRFAWDDNRKLYVDNFFDYRIGEDYNVRTYQPASGVGNAYYVKQGLSTEEVSAKTLHSALTKAVENRGVTIPSGFQTENELFSLASQVGIDAVVWTDADKVTSVIPVGQDVLERFDYSSTLLGQLDELNQSEFIRNSLTPQQLDELYDLGIISKAPMTNTEVQDYLRAKYSLPFDTLESMVELDPATLMSSYVSSLNHAAANSSFIVSLASPEAVDAGWAIKNSDVVPGSPQSRWTALGDIYERLEQAGINVPENKAAASYRVHPRIASIVENTLKIGSDPAHLHVIAHSVRRVTQLLNALNLTARFHMYPISNFITNYILGTLAGLNPLQIPVAIGDIFRVFKEGIEGTDNVSKIYNVVGSDGYQVQTERQLFAEFLQANATGYAPGLSNVGVKSYDNLADILTDSVSWLIDGPRKLPRALAELFNLFTADASKIGVERSLGTRLFDTLSLGVDQFDRQAREAFAPLGYIANNLELAIKWAVYKSIAKRTDWSVSKLGNFISGRYVEFDNIADMNAHINDYFIRPEGVGTAIQWAELLFPYLRYAWKTPFIITRDVMRRPWFYYNLYRMRSAYQDFQNDRYDIREAGIEPWLADTYPLILGGKRKSDGSVDEMWYLLTESWDPITQTVNTYNDTFGTLGSLLGLPGGTSAQERAKLRGDLWLQNAQSIVSNMHPLWKTIIESSTGVNSLTGAPIDTDTRKYSWNGIPVTDRQRHILNNIPLLGFLDKQNPGFFAGQSPVVDANGNVISPGKPAWFTGAERKRGTDSKKYSLQNASTAMKILALAGLNVRYSNYDKNLQTTWGDLDATIKKVGEDLDAERKRMKSDITKGIYVDPNAQRQFLEKWNDRVAILGQLQYDKIKLEQYMLSRGILDPSSVTQLNKLEADTNEVLNGPLMPDSKAIEDTAKWLSEQLYQNEEVFNER